MASHEEQLRQISCCFQIHGDLLYAQPLTTGHINQTYVATYSQGGTRVRYLHQSINQAVFQDPEALMDNVVRVTTHLRHKLEGARVPEPSRRALTVVPTRAGKPLLRQDGQAWRTFVFIEGVQHQESVQSPEQAKQAGRAFGEFQQALADLPGERLRETIPDFHHTRKRFLALQQALQDDRCNRAQAAQPEIRFALAHESMVDVILGQIAQGKIPERITHNDTKFNNLLLDSTTGQALCVVDLDTVMPGSALYDFGDLVRTATSPTAEDEADLSKVGLQMALFEKLAQGYLSAAGPFLSGSERALLAFSGKLITFEMGLRFLTDYLDGDTYYRIHRPAQNLERCRTQFKLVESIEAQEEAMQRLVASL